MKVNIDKNSGFCFGVVYAVEKAEEKLDKNKKLFCLGDIVHNDMEVERLNNRGLKIINFKKYESLKNETVLLRAHGEAPEIYKIAQKNNLNIIDASCPIVLKLQIKIKKALEEMQKKDGQVVIFGKKGHAEVIGLSGNANNQTIIISSINDLDLIDYTKPISLFSQTTKSSKTYHEIIEGIKLRLKNNDFTYLDSVCKQVANRDKDLKQFCKENELIIFMSGIKSSNGKMLYNVCLSENSNSKFITKVDEIKTEWFKGIKNVGITGATSTPTWLMKQAKNHIENL